MNAHHYLPLVAAAFITGMAAYHFISRHIRNRVIRRRFSRGAEGEREAQAFLRKRGYRIVEIQARRRMRMLVDGKECGYEIRADLIAEKRGRRCVVEVKTGGKAVDPASTDTRRQLLEYALSYEVDLVYLFDADSGMLHEIGLPAIRKRSSHGAWRFAAGVIAGIVITLAVMVLMKLP